MIVFGLQFVQLSVNDTQFTHKITLFHSLSKKSQNLQSTYIT